jgi:hypothetical protein
MCKFVCTTGLKPSKLKTPPLNGRALAARLGQVDLRHAVKEVARVSCSKTNIHTLTSSYSEDGTPQRGHLGLLLCASSLNSTVSVVEQAVVPDARSTGVRLQVNYIFIAFIA